MEKRQKKMIQIRGNNFKSQLIRVRIKGWHGNLQVYDLILATQSWGNRTRAKALKVSLFSIG